MSSPAEDFVRLVDGLEDRATGYVTLDDVERQHGATVEPYVADAILLVDYRTRADGSEVALCRLNRRHPLVARLTSW